MGHFRPLVVALATLGLIVVTLVALPPRAVGALARSSRHVAPATTVFGPGFVRARGWNVLETGLTIPPQAPTASAANVPFAAGDRSQQSPPTATVSSLRSGGVVLWAQLYPSGGNPAIDRTFPPRRLPLRLADAFNTTNPEGFNGKGAVRRIDARAEGYNIDVVIFFGSRAPSTQAVAAARNELARLVVPQCPTAAKTLGRGDLQAATSSLLVWLHAHYVGRPSDLRGARVAASVVSRAASARIRFAAAMCRAEASRIAAVTVTPPAQGRVNIGPQPLLYFLSKTANGWSIWREG